MSQTSIIAAALIIGYIVFIIMRGDAPKWLTIIGLSSSGLIQAGGQTPIGTFTGITPSSSSISSILGQI